MQRKSPSEGDRTLLVAADDPEAALQIVRESPNERRFAEGIRIVRNKVCHLSRRAVENTDGFDGTERLRNLVVPQEPNLRRLQTEALPVMEVRCHRTGQLGWRRRRRRKDKHRETSDQVMFIGSPASFECGRPAGPHRWASPLPSARPSCRAPSWTALRPALRPLPDRRLRSGGSPRATPTR